MSSKSVVEPIQYRGARRRGISSAVGLRATLVAILATLSVGCATTQGTARAAQPSSIARDGKWLMVPSFPLVLQEQNDDCGAAALAAVLRFWGYDASPRSIEAVLGRNDSRLKAGDMMKYAQSLGLRSYVFFGTMKDIQHELAEGRPVIVGLGKKVAKDKAISHYEVVVGLEPTQKRLLLLDPGRGWQVDTIAGFAEEWALSRAVMIVNFLPEANPSVARR